MKFRKIEWNGNDPKSIMTSYTKVFGNKDIGFRLMNCADGNLKLIDFSNNNMTYIVRDIEEGKQKAQELFCEYCEEILRNICE